MESQYKQPGRNKMKQIIQATLTVSIGIFLIVTYFQSLSAAWGM